MKKITIVADLVYFRPRIWRRFEISDQNNLQELMDLIMILFKMTSLHLYNLEIPVAQNEFARNNRDENGKLTKRMPRFPFQRAETVEPDRSISKLDYGVFSPGFFDDESNKSSHIYDKIKALDKIESLNLYKGDKMFFYYDYGDDWQIKLVVEKVEDDNNTENMLVPKLLKGKGYGIIEDVGGVYGLGREFYDNPNLKNLYKEELIDDIEYYFSDNLDQ
ncbi:MAG: hypothetical protein PUG67_01100 [Peptoniphilaceae bacterium]|nr:hypothetical protein [Peptoniphilaceae bacterium]MDY6018598.1 hypothetical protein [Anaerococcus sp.]